MKKERLKPEIPEDDDELSPEQIRELKRRIADHRNPVRYVIYSDLLPGGRWRLFFNVSADTFCDELDTATLFKREHVARAVAKVYSKGRRNDLFIAKITTKNGKRKVLKYEKPEHRTSGSRRRGKPRA